MTKIKSNSSTFIINNNTNNTTRPLPLVEPINTPPSYNELTVKLLDIDIKKQIGVIKRTKIILKKKGTTSEFLSKLKLDAQEKILDYLLKDKAKLTTGIR